MTAASTRMPGTIGLGDPVGEPLGDALAGLFGFDDGHDSGERVVRDHGGCVHLQDTGPVDRTGRDCVAGTDIDRDRLAGDRREVHAASARPRRRRRSPRAPRVARRARRRPPGPTASSVWSSAGALHGDRVGDQRQQGPEAVAGSGQRELLERLASGEQDCEHRRLGQLTQRTAPTAAIVISERDPQPPGPCVAEAPGHEGPAAQPERERAPPHRCTESAPAAPATNETTRQAAAATANQSSRIDHSDTAVTGSRRRVSPSGRSGGTAALGAHRRVAPSVTSSSSSQASPG